MHMGGCMHMGECMHRGDSHIQMVLRVSLGVLHPSLAPLVAIAVRSLLARRDHCC